MKKTKVVMKDMVGENLEVMDFNQKSYDVMSDQLFKQLKENLNATLIQFRHDRRMDKIQMLQAIVHDFITKVIIEKHSLNMEFVNAEMKLDPTLKAKIESMSITQNKTKDSGQIRFEK